MADVSFAGKTIQLLTKLALIVAILFLGIPTVLAQENIDPDYYVKIEAEYKAEQLRLEKEAEELRIKLLSEELTARAQKLVGVWQGQCVIGVRKFLGVGRNVVQGRAITTKTDTTTWTVGAIIVLRLSSAGHVGVTLYSDGVHGWYYDTNGDWTERGAIRKIRLDSPLIVGYKIIKL